MEKGHNKLLLDVHAFFNQAWNNDCLNLTMLWTNSAYDIFGDIFV